MSEYFDVLKVANSEFFLVAGTGVSNVSALNAFDFALIDAGVGDANIIRLSSILPPNFTQIEPRKPKPGALLPVAYAKSISDDVYMLTLQCAAIGVGVPKDRSLPGLIMEHVATHVVGFKKVSNTTADDVQVAESAKRKVKWEQLVTNQVIRMVEEGMSGRKVEWDYIKTKCAVIETRRNEMYGAAFAGVVLI